MTEGRPLIIGRRLARQALGTARFASAHPPCGRRCANASRRHSAARERLLQLAARAGQDIANEIEPLYTALRLGAEPSHLAARLDELAQQAQGPIVGMYAAHARALIEKDPSKLVEVATQFEEIGRDLFAAETAAQAAVLANQQGLRHLSRRAAVLSQRCAQRCQGVQTPALNLTVEVDSLTAREREIAALAARGLTNAAIADELTLSVRSVETYVLRACRKLGIASRTELASVLHGTG